MAYVADMLQRTWNQGNEPQSNFELKKKKMLILNEMT